MEWYIIWTIVIGGVFGFMWRKGYLLRLTQYVQLTKVELKKCSWPTVEELKASTVIVIVSTAILGAFVVGIDFLVSQFLHYIM